MKVVTSSEMRAIENHSEVEGVLPDDLMENAGLAVANAAKDLLLTVAGAKIMVLIGPGNNGEDGLVAARHLRRWGAEVKACHLTRRSTQPLKLKGALEHGVESCLVEQDLGLSDLQHEMSSTELIIDAVLGIGHKRPLSGVIKKTFEIIKERQRSGYRMKILAIDIPTGLNPDNGQIDPFTLTADLTVALGFPKVGLLMFPGAEKVGALRVADIGIPSRLSRDINLELNTGEYVAKTIPKRKMFSHKGTFGNLLVIAGSRKYVGAALLACKAALRSGVGLVTLASPDSVYRILAPKLPEVVHFPLPEDDDGQVHFSAADVLKAQVDRYTSVLIGCGLGWSTGVREFLEKFLMGEPGPAIPAVIDADALNNLSDIENWWEGINCPAVVTPHPREMSRLTGVSIEDIQAGRHETAKKYAFKWGVTTVLKGAFTIIASQNSPTIINSFANPILSSGGTGDVLAGTIGGLMAQGLKPMDAARCGVYLHGMAAEKLSSVSGQSGALAGEVADQLPIVMKNLITK